MDRHKHEHINLDITIYCKHASCMYVLIMCQQEFLVEKLKSFVVLYTIVSLSLIFYEKFNHFITYQVPANS